MKKSLLTVFLFIVLSSCGEKIYMKKSIAFIKEIKQKELADANFILVDKPYTLESFGCLEQFMNDADFFTKDEIAFIQKTIKTSSFKWNTELFGGLKMVSSDTVQMIFKDNAKGWRYFYKHFGNGFYTFSKPIFLRNDTYCLFYSDYSCGYTCGEGHLNLYKKENNKWIEVKTYCNWIS